MVNDINSPDIIFAMNNFNETGIPIVICTLLNQWDVCENGTVALSVHEKTGRFLSQYHADIPLYVLDEIVSKGKKGGGNFFTRVRAYIKLIKDVKPRKVIAVNQGEALALCIAKRFTQHFKLVVCEHCNVTEINHEYKGWFGWYYRHFFKHEYNYFADVIHTVSEESKDDLVNNWGFPKDKIKVIYNPAMIDKSRVESKRSYRDDGKFIITTACRLEQGKRIDVLLKGLARTKEKYGNELLENVYVNIMGDGRLKNELETLCQELGLSDIVSFKGFVQAPWRYVASSDLFVLTSEYEGLSVAIIEAQTVGTAVLASDCPSGNKELLMYGKAGKLFRKNDIEDFADKLADILKNKSQLELYSQIANEHLDRFSIESIIKQYAEI